MAGGSVRFIIINNGSDSCLFKSGIELCSVSLVFIVMDGCLWALHLKTIYLSLVGQEEDGLSPIIGHTQSAEGTIKTESWLLLQSLNGMYSARGLGMS